MLRKGQVRPQTPWDAKVLTVKVRVASGHPSAEGAVTVTDVLFQAGGTVTGWVPHVTEMPWTAGITP
jgi:hypothetical protein